MRWWPWSRRIAAPRAETTTRSISDPALASWLGIELSENHSGVEVTERSALGSSALYRAVSLVGGTLGQLPLRTLRPSPTMPGQEEQVPSVLDAPGGPYGPTPFEWVETLVLHVMIQGAAYLVHRRNQAGALDRLILAHRLAVRHELPGPGQPEPPGGQWFHVTWSNGQISKHDGTTLTFIPGLSSDGLAPYGLIDIARNSVGTAVAGDRAAARMFSRGALMGGIASVEEDCEDEELVDARRSINRAASGWEKAGGIALINRKITLTPWTMKAVDAQFLESRQFSVEEISRWTGVPPHLLMQTEKQTSWGTGVTEQNRGLNRFTLGPIATRIDQRLTRMLGRGRRAAFDFSRLERATPEVETQLAISEVAARIITPEEARSRLHPELPPLEQPGPIQGGPNEG